MRFLVAIFAVFMSLQLVSCSEDSPTSNASQPEIESFTPIVGPESTQVTILGKNFGYDRVNSSVYFGDRKAFISQINHTSIVAYAPKIMSGLDSEKLQISFSYNGLTAISSNKYTLLSDNYSTKNFDITSFSPDKGKQGTTIIIYGKGFGVKKGNCTVTFGTQIVPIDNINDSTISVKTPFPTDKYISEQVIISVVVNGVKKSFTDHFDLLGSDNIVVLNTTRLIVAFSNFQLNDSAGNPVPASVQCDQTLKSSTSCGSYYQGSEFLFCLKEHVYQGLQTIIDGNASMNAHCMIDTLNKVISSMTFQYSFSYDWINTFLGGPDGGKRGHRDVALTFSLANAPYILDASKKIITIELSGSALASSLTSGYYDDENRDNLKGNVLLDKLSNASMGITIYLNY